MSHKIYDFLKRKRLNNKDKIISEIGRLSATEISDLCEDLSDVISRRDLGSTKAIKNSPFNFTATPFTVGFDGPCGEWDCKLSQSSDFVRFAILYADSCSSK